MLIHSLVSYVFFASLAPLPCQRLTVLVVRDNFTQIGANNAVELATRWANAEPTSFHVVTATLDVHEIREDFRLRLCSLISRANSEFRPVAVIFDDCRSSVMSEFVRQFAGQMDIVAISARLSINILSSNWLFGNGSAFSVRTHPPEKILFRLIREISVSTQFSVVVLLHDDTFITDDLLVNTPIRHLVLKLNQHDDVCQFRNWTYVVFFVAGETSFVNKVLKSATDCKMLDEGRSWYATSKDSPLPVKLSCRGHHCSLIKLEVDMDEKLSETSNLRGEMSTTDFYFYFNMAVDVLSIVRDNMIVSSLNLSADHRKCTQNLNSDSQFKNQEHDKSRHYRDVGHQLGLKLSKLTKLNDTQREIRMTDWESRLNGSVKMDVPPNSFPSKPNLVYKVVTFIEPPFVYKTNSTDKPFYGLCVDLMDQLSAILNFKYEIYESDIPYVDEKDTWHGVFNEIAQKRAHMILGPVSVMSERQSLVDFTIPFYDMVGISILTRKFSQPSSLFKFLNVLESQVWMSILVAYFFTSFLLWLLDRFSPLNFRTETIVKNVKYKPTSFQSPIFSLKESLWFCITSLTPQGGGETPRSVSGRLMAATWWLFGFVVVASYTANLAAFLTVSRIDTTINNLDDLVKQHKIKFAPVNGSAAMTYFRRMAHIERIFYRIWVNMTLDESTSEEDRTKLSVWDYPVSDKFSKMWQMIQDFGLPTTFQEGVQRTIDGDFALFAETTQVKYATMTNCELTSVGEEFSRKPYALAVRKNSPLKDQLSRGILKIQSERKLEQLKDKWWNENPERKKCQGATSFNQGIGIKNIGGVFLVIIIGIVFAFLGLALEYFWHRFRDPTQVRVSSHDRRVKKRVRNSTFTVLPRTYYFHY